MKNNSIILLLMIAVLLAGCGWRNQQIVDPKVLDGFLNVINQTSSKKIAVATEMAFWKNRFMNNQEDFASMNKYAALLKENFNYTGNVAELNEADSFYQSLAPILTINSSSLLKSWATLSITRHQFRKADSLINKALAKGDNKYGAYLLAFDASMEIGNYAKAKQFLQTIGDKKSFDYLIRLAKFEDHVNGDLEKAIVQMENAMATITDASSANYSWVKANLGDMYCHANQPKKAYQYYMDVLAIDSSNFHCLKSIAWLAYAQDQNTALAKTILHQLQQVHPVPDYDLMLSEIAAFENNLTEKEKHLNSFIAKVSSDAYGNMYNKYLFGIYADEQPSMEKASAIARAEVALRPTAETYSWLAWSYLKQGNKAEALKLAQAIASKTEEPDAVLTIGKIYLANGDKTKAKECFAKLASAGLEIGPLANREVKDMLAQL
jgi:tetratricopeptide (TPR) repeat protein